MHMKFKTYRSFLLLILLCMFCMIHAGYASVVTLSNVTEANVTIVDNATEIGDNYVRYPQLDGMDDSTLQQMINNTIVDEANILQRLVTLSSLQQGGTGLQVSYSTYMHNALFTTTISAYGTMDNLRSGHSYTALAYDLISGERLTIADFFTDPEATVAWMEEQLLANMDDAFSYYLEHADITPLPSDSFSFDQNGITFYYPYQQFALLSGYSASAQFQYGELQEFLIPNENSVPVRLNAFLPQYTDVQIKENIEAIVAKGMLPYLDVTLGDSVFDLITDYGLTRTPDHFQGGRYFQFEAPAFRNILIMSDALADGYEASIVEGILAMRMNLYGIQTGVTEQKRWREILGEPSVSVYYDSFLAADYGLPICTADYYSIANRQLILFADESGVLYAIRLSK